MKEFKLVYRISNRIYADYVYAKNVRQAKEWIRNEIVGDVTFIDIRIIS